jgi:hypothetical protein
VGLASGVDGAGGVGFVAWTCGLLPSPFGLSLSKASYKTKSYADTTKKVAKYDHMKVTLPSFFINSEKFGINLLVCWSPQGEFENRPQILSNAELTAQRVGNSGAGKKRTGDGADATKAK